MLPQPATSSFASAILGCALRMRAFRVGFAAAHAHLDQRRLKAGERRAEAAAAAVELARSAEFLEHLGVAMHQGGVAVAAYAQRPLPLARHRVAGPGDDSVGQ